MFRIIAFMLMMFFVSPAMSYNCQGFSNIIEKSKNKYLVQILSIEKDDFNPTSKTREDIATVKVLRVYRGNTSKLKKLDKIYIKVSCTGVRGIDCSILEDKNYPFYIGKTMLVFTNEPYKQKVNVGKCGGNYLTISDSGDLMVWEQIYEPMWPNKD